MNQSMWADKAHEPAKMEESHPTISNEPEPALDTSAPPSDDSLSEMYASTGPQQSDLFDDVTPVESMRLRSDDDLFSDDFTPAAQPVVEQIKPQGPPGGSESASTMPQGRGRGRGSYDGRAGRDRGGGHRGARGPEDGQRGNRKQTQGHAQAQSRPPDNAPSGPRQESVASVRGNRQATGGFRKPKLTEEELAEKMAKIQIKNASLTAAHARAEADAAFFAEREQQAKQVSEQRQKEERKDRQQMMGEREKNRQRKLKAIGGREWDAEKKDEDFSKGGRFDKKGGFAGDQEDYADGREYLYRDPITSGDRGRGGRGRGGRGGRPREAAVPKTEDFPALPSNTQVGSKDSQSGETSVDPELVKSSGKSWADQVEASPTT